MSTFVAANRRKVTNLFITAFTLVSLVAIPVAASAAPAKPVVNNVAARQADKAPFKFLASTAVQKGLDLLKKYGIPESTLKYLIGSLSDSKELTKALIGLKLIKLTDAQIAAFVKEADTLATDKKDPLTTKAYETWVANGMARSIKAKKIAPKDTAKLAVLGGAPSKTGKITGTKSLVDISAALKQAEPTLSDKDIEELLFWFDVGYNQLYLEVYQVFYLEQELEYYDVSPEVIQAIIEHFDDQQATEAELAKAGVSDSISQRMLDAYHEKLDELGPQACGCAALQAIAMTTKALFEENGVSLADQIKIQEAFAKGDLAGAAQLAGAAGVPTDQLVELQQAISEVQALAGADYKAYMEEQAAKTQANADETALDLAIEHDAQEPQPPEPAEEPAE